ncbi:MAG TPA: hypothetical protein IAC41_00720 [Candidatus Merdenecus merdavium]|nr:hypothetical protein [Candidatus Merdenecus merdavium]
MKAIRKILSIGLVVSLVSSFSLVASAEDVQTPLIGAEQSLLDSDPALRYTLIMNGSVSITETGQGLISLYGQTSPIGVADVVSISLYAERLNGNTWVSAGSIPKAIDYNSVGTGTYGTLKVSRGYYYRGRAVHSVKKGTQTESAVSYTQGIWIG